MSAKFVFCLIQLLEGLGIGAFFPIYTPWMELHGLNFLKMGYMNFVYHILSTILDPFTGFFADRFGKRFSFILGQLLWSGTQFIYGASSNTLGFMTAEAVAAVGASLKSDALESWLLNKLGKDIAQETMATAKIYYTIGTIISSVISGYLSSTVGMSVAWYFSGSFFLISTLVGGYALMCAGTDLAKKKSHRLSLLKVIGIALSNKKILSTAILVALYSLASKPVFMYWPQTAKLLGLSEQHLGWVIFVLTIPVLIGGQLVGKNIIFKTNREGFVRILLFLSYGLLLGCFATNIWIFLFSLILIEIPYGAIAIVTYGYLYEEIDPAYVSTTNSLISAVKTLGGAISLLAMGKIADMFSPQIAYGVGSLLILSALIYLVVTKKKYM